jgi:GTPase Era involved in 16S rRNA processing
LPNGQKLPVILFGNKVDLIKGESPVSPCVSDEEIEAVVKEHGFFKYYPCSALDGSGIHEAIEELVAEIVRRMSLEADGSGSTADFYHQQHPTAPSVDIKTQRPDNNTQGGCC